MLEDLGLSIRQCLRPALVVALLGLELDTCAHAVHPPLAFFARDKPPLERP